VKFDGNSGGASYVATAAIAVSGRGADGPWGGSGREVIAQGGGAAGTLYGGGGSGALTLSGGAATAGGAGGQGVLIIYEFA
jgi:hypothetical protein